MTYCEDFPCCGHTDLDPCAPQWYDAPDAFDTRVNPHAFCEHEFGMCDVWDEGDEIDPDDCAHDSDLSFLNDGLIRCDACGEEGGSWEKGEDGWAQILTFIPSELPQTHPF